MPQRNNQAGQLALRPIALHPRFGQASSECTDTVIHSTDKFGWRHWVFRTHDHIGGRWFGDEQRIGSDGRKWKTEPACYVADDFGTLIEVPR